MESGLHAIAISISFFKVLVRAHTSAFNPEDMMFLNAFSFFAGRQLRLIYEIIACYYEKSS